MGVKEGDCLPTEVGAEVQERPQSLLKLQRWEGRLGVNAFLDSPCACDRQDSNR